jgi:hypothetical protein
MCGWMDSRTCSSMGPNKAVSMPIELAKRNKLWHESMGIKQVPELLSQWSHTKRTMVLGIAKTGSRQVPELLSQWSHTKRTMTTRNYRNWQMRYRNLKVVSLCSFRANMGLKKRLNYKHRSGYKGLQRFQKTANSSTPQHKPPRTEIRAPCRRQMETR